MFLYTDSKGADQEPAYWYSRGSEKVAVLPNFYVVSISGQTHLVCARSRNEAVNLLAEEKGLGTDRADWTELSDTMFEEISLAEPIQRRVMSRSDYLLLCRRTSQYIGRVLVS